MRMIEWWMETELLRHMNDPFTAARTRTRLHSRLNKYVLSSHGVGHLLLEQLRLQKCVSRLSKAQLVDSTTFHICIIWLHHLMVRRVIHFVVLVYQTGLCWFITHILSPLLSSSSTVEVEFSMNIKWNVHPQLHVHQSFLTKCCSVPSYSYSWYSWFTTIK